MRVRRVGAEDILARINAVAVPQRFVCVGLFLLRGKQFCMITSLFPIHLLLLVSVNLVHAVIVPTDIVDVHHILKKSGPKSKTSHEGEYLCKHAQPALPSRNSDLRYILRKIEINVNNKRWLLFWHRARNWRLIRHHVIGHVRTIILRYRGVNHLLASNVWCLLQNIGKNTSWYLRWHLWLAGCNLILIVTITDGHVIAVKILITEWYCSRPLEVSIWFLKNRKITHVKLQWLLLVHTSCCSRNFSISHRYVMKLVALIALIIQEILVVDGCCFQIYLQLRISGESPFLIIFWSNFTS